MNRKERTIFVTLVINALLIGFKFWLVIYDSALQAYYERIAAPAGGAQQPSDGP